MNFHSIFTPGTIPGLKSILPLVAALAMALPATAQDDLFDDIYYNPDKEPKSTAQPVAPVQQQPVYITGDDIDVDAYNRRGFFYVPDSAGFTLQPVDSLGADFANTRRIERFYNPSLLDGSADSLAVAQSYMVNSPADYYNPGGAQSVNIYVNNVDPFYYYGMGYGYPYYNPYYPAWYASPYWGSYWGYGWGPTWGWSWGWGPSWSWAWGPGWDWAPGPVGPPPPPARPYNSRHPGAMAANRPNYGGGTVGNRPSTGANGQRPGVGTLHPGTGQPGTSGGNRRPTTGTSGIRPGTSVKYTGNFKPAQGVLPTRPSSTGTMVQKRPGVQPNKTVTTTRQPQTNNRYNYNQNHNSGSRPGTGWGSGGGGNRGGFGGGNRGGGGHGGGRGGRH